MDWGRFPIPCSKMGRYIWKIGNHWPRVLKLFMFVFVFVLCPKSLKLPSGLTKLCSFINKDYDYD